MVDKDTKLALCPNCGSPDLMAVTLAFHAITEDLDIKGVFEHQDWGDDYHLECEHCNWSDGAWGLTHHSESSGVSLKELTYATIDEARELWKIRKQFEQERDAPRPSDR